MTGTPSTDPDDPSTLPETPETLETSQNNVMCTLPGVRESLRSVARLTPEIVEARRAYVEPLFDYCAQQSIIVIRVVRRAALRLGTGHFSRNRLMRVKQGVFVAPEWFITEVCRELGQPIERVMGAEWMQRHVPTPASTEVPTTHEQRAS